MENKNCSENGLEILVTVVNREKTEFYLDFLQSFEVNMQMSMLATGGSTPEKIAKLDFLDSQRTVIFSVIREDKVKYALRALNEKFAGIRNGNGIAFTIPMTSVIGVSVFGFLSNNLMTVREEK